MGADIEVTGEPEAPTPSPPTASPTPQPPRASPTVTPTASPTPQRLTTTPTPPPPTLSPTSGPTPSPSRRHNPTPLPTPFGSGECEDLAMDDYMPYTCSQVKNLLDGKQYCAHH